MVMRWLYRKSDGVFLSGGFFDVQLPTIGDPAVPDTANYGIAEFGDADTPDIKLHRYDAVLGKRLATAQELTDATTSALSATAQTDSRRLDIVATCALIVKRSNPTAWSNMTAAQKKAAVLAAADDWRDLRVLIDKFI
jgi:hypothetical protein